MGVFPIFHCCDKLCLRQKVQTYNNDLYYSFYDSGEAGLRPRWHWRGNLGLNYKQDKDFTSISGSCVNCINVKWADSVCHTDQFRKLHSINAFKHKLRHGTPLILTYCFIEIQSGRVTLKKIHGSFSQRCILLYATIHANTTHVSTPNKACKWFMMRKIRNTKNVFQLLNK